MMVQRLQKHIDDYEIYGIPSSHHAEVDVIHVETIGFSNHKHSGEVKPHQHSRRDQYFLWRKGHGTLQLLDRNIPVNAPMLVVMPMGHVHGMALFPDAEIVVVSPTRAFLVASAGPELVNRVQSIASPEVISLSGSQTTSLGCVFEQLLKEYAAMNTFYLAACSGLMRLLLAYIYRTLLDQSQVHIETGGEHLVSRFHAMVEAAFRQDRSVKQYARDLAVSQRQLIRACHALAGKSPSQLILNRRMLEAQRLLRFTNLSISQISAELHFHDASHFSRFFKARIGSSPIAWREEHDVSLAGAREQ